MIRRSIRVERGGRVETIDLDELAAGDPAERAAIDANAWIKSLRQAEVDGMPFRDRFTYRGDSLWWFAELFLHKEAAVESWWRTAHALDTVCAAAQPDAIGIDHGDDVLFHLLPQAAARHGCRTLRPVAAQGAAGGLGARWARAARSRAYTWGALASHWVRRGLPADLEGPGGTLAFVHSAFWRRLVTGAGGGADRAGDGEEGYIGAVIEALGNVEGATRRVRLIGVGPSRNFRARRWWHPLLASTRATAPARYVIPVERFAAGRTLDGSTAVWRARRANALALTASEDLRARARAAGYDVWPLLAAELKGIAVLQFPWSARAMDEAAAALEVCRPDVAVTYAEAGGWGRALMLEARRRDIASVGLQHGFIYRHWLNYRHEPDEMQASLRNPRDRGFPRPDLTLVFDGFAASHLESAGRFPPDTVKVTGSPALDRLARGLAALDGGARDEVRRLLGTGANHLAVVVSKHSQIRRELPWLIEAAARTPGLALVVKPHPAETADPYLAPAAAAEAVRVAPASLDLTSLLSVARAVVTVNSTVAIDAMVLGIPALVVGLPNNLSPFVDAGAMAGTRAGRPAGEMLARICLDDAVRQGLLESGRRFAATWGIRADGQAADRAARAIAELGGRGRPKA